MKNNLIQLCLAILLLVTSSCQKKKKEIIYKTKDFLTFNVQDAAVNDLKISSLSDSITYVFLESNKDIFVGDITKLEIVNDTIFVMDKTTSSIFCFDINGKLIYKLKTGNSGPGEFKALADFSVNIKTHELCILSDEEESIYKYKLNNGAFISTVSLNGFFNKIQNIGLSTILLGRDEYKSPEDDYFDNNTICLFDDRGRYLKGWFAELTTKKLNFGNVTFCQNLINSTTSICKLANDTIYTNYNSDSLQANYAINFGLDSIKKNQLYNAFNISEAKQIMDDGSYILNFLTNNKYLAINFSLKKRGNLYWYDKKQKKGNHIILENDLDGVPLPNYINFMDNNKMVTYFNPGLLKMIILNKEKSDEIKRIPKLLEIKKRINYDSNPMLVLINLK